MTPVGPTTADRGPVGSRAYKLGTRLTVLTAALCLLGGCGSSGSRYPSFLPEKTLGSGVDATLIGTMSKPALTVEGLAVKVVTGAWDVEITVSGPVVPGEGLPVQKAATTCTWTVTMVGATGDVPVALGDFHSVDHLGRAYLMGLVPGENPPPDVLHPGQDLTFQVRAYELVGEGLMQWAPDHQHVAAEWDYSVEND